MPDTVKVRLSTGETLLGNEPVLELEGEVYNEQILLGNYAGNVYIHVDGVEWGSLFFYREGEQIRIGLGQYDDETDQWEFRDQLTHPVYDASNPRP